MPTMIFDREQTNRILVCIIGFIIGAVLVLCMISWRPAHYFIIANYQRGEERGKLELITHAVKENNYSMVDLCRYLETSLNCSKIHIVYMQKL